MAEGDVAPPTITYIADVDGLEEYEWDENEGSLTMTSAAIEEMKVRGCGQRLVRAGACWGVGL